MSIRILLRDFRSVVKDGRVVNFNIGTTAHGPGVAAMLEKELPDCEICFWASSLGGVSLLIADNLTHPHKKRLKANIPILFILFPFQHV